MVSQAYIKWWVTNDMVTPEERPDVSEGRRHAFIGSRLLQAKKTTMKNL